jgi:hypothetical protein
MQIVRMKLALSGIYGLGLASSGLMMVMALHANAEPPAVPAPDSLAGSLPKTIKAGVHFVIADIEVPANKIVGVEPGAVFLFREFTGLHIMGRMTAEGTRERPIIFTSCNDQTFNPDSSRIANPYDWNGVYIHADAFGTSMRNCGVFYSVYGLVSETKFIRLDPVQFLHNGRSNLTIENVEQKVGEEPFRYVLSVKDATVDGVSVKLIEDPLAKKRAAVRYGSLGVAVICCTGGIIFARSAFKAQDELNGFSSKGFDNLNRNESSIWLDVRSRRNTNIFLSVLSFAAGAAGVWGFHWSFTF